MGTSAIFSHIYTIHSTAKPTDRNQCGPASMCLYTSPDIQQADILSSMHCKSNLQDVLSCILLLCSTICYQCNNELAISFCLISATCLETAVRLILFPFLSAAVSSGEDCSENENLFKEASHASRQAHSAAKSADADVVTSGPPDSSAAQPFSLPKQIHSAASLVNGVSSRLRALPSQIEATQDPMRLSNNPDQVQDQAGVGRGSLPFNQVHWQDDYATNWDRVAVGRNASPSDAAAAAMQHVSCPSSLQDESHARSGKGKAWACKLCTFAANPNHSIRCQVCDTVRGTTLQDYRPPTTDVPGDDRKSSQLSPPSHSERHPGSNAGLQRKRQSSERSQHSIARFLGARNQSGAEAVATTPSIAHQKPGVATIHHEKSAASSASAWTRVEFDTEVRWQCAKCECCLQTEQKAEHEDYHLALDHQHQSNGMQHKRYIQVKRQKSQVSS